MKTASPVRAASWVHRRGWQRPSWPRAQPKAEQGRRQHEPVSVAVAQSVRTTCQGDHLGGRICDVPAPREEQHDTANGSQEEVNVLAKCRAQNLRWTASWTALPQKGVMNTGTSSGENFP